MVARVMIVALVALGVVACAPEPAPADGEPFIALERDFQDFRDWPSFDLPDASLSMSHRTGARRLYFLGMPDAPGAPFPVGAILVKTVEDGEPATWEIHAMAKRGGGYNPDGAREWEFFDLAIDASDQVVVRWRGEGPPPGAAGYPGSGVGEGQCNGCHGLFPDRDYVFDRPLFE